MAMFDYYEDNRCMHIHKTTTCVFKYQSQWNKTLSAVGHLFGFLFAFESILKIVGLGFACGRKAYFRSGWNTLDFIIVMCWTVEFTLDMTDYGGLNMRALRTLRILRPLKAMKTIPSLRK